MAGCFVASACSAKWIQTRVIPAFVRMSREPSNSWRSAHFGVARSDCPDCLPGCCAFFPTFMFLMLRGRFAIFGSLSHS